LAAIVPAPEELEDEDLLEMANAGLVKVLVVDNHKAWFWQRVWPKLILHPTVTLRTNGEIAWAIRPDSPGLLKALNDFLAVNGKDSLNARMIFRRYLLNTQYVKGTQRPDRTSPSRIRRREILRLARNQSNPADQRNCMLFSIASYVGCRVPKSD
jgi:membrane-bound lytic murein transglycosylase MltF